MSPTWISVGFDAWALGIDASFTAGLRLYRMATGAVGAATETRLMVDEKVQAAMELQARAMSGKLGMTPMQASRATLAHYRRKVAANRRRLSA